MHRPTWRSTTEKSVHWSFSFGPRPADLFMSPPSFAAYLLCDHPSANVELLDCHQKAAQRSTDTPPPPMQGDNAYNALSVEHSIITASWIAYLKRHPNPGQEFPLVAAEKVLFKEPEPPLPSAAGRSRGMRGANLRSPLIAASATSP